MTLQVQGATAARPGRRCQQAVRKRNRANAPHTAAVHLAPSVIAEALAKRAGYAGNRPLSPAWAWGEGPLTEADPSPRPYPTAQPSAVTSISFSNRELSARGAASDIRTRA